MKKASITWPTILVKGTQKCNFSPRLMLTSAIYHFFNHGAYGVIYILKNNSYSFLIRKALHVFILQFGKYKNYEKEDENQLLSCHPEKSFITFHTCVCVCFAKSNCAAWEPKIYLPGGQQGRVTVRSAGDANQPESICQVKWGWVPLFHMILTFKWVCSWMLPNIQDSRENQRCLK